MSDQGASIGSAEGLRAWVAALLGIVLILIGFLGFLYLRPSGAAQSIGMEAVGGIVLLSLSLGGLIIVSKALGISTPQAALGLPGGSVRALLAFSLVVVFVAVASWSLGDHKSQESYSSTHMPAADEEAFAKLQTAYPAPRFYVSWDGKKDAVIVDTVSQQQLFDLQKQIMTIVATVLVTIVGFYFGSKSASDAVVSANQTVASVTKALKGGDSGAAEAEPTKDELQVTRDGIRAIATNLQGKLKDLGDDPLAIVRDAAGKVPGNAPVQGQLAKAETALTMLTKQATGAETDADRADQGLAALDAGTEEATTIKTWLDSYQQEAMDASKAFDTALADFNQSKNAVLTPTAEG